MPETVSLPTSDGPMAAYRAAPDGSPLGGVIVVQEAFGLTDHIEDVTRRFAGAGYLTLAPALFHRTGAPTVPYDDYEGTKPHTAALSRDGLVADLDASFGHLRELGVPAQAQAVVGFCLGGSVATFAATAYAVGAAVSFYGGGVSQGRFGLEPLADLAAGLSTPWLGIYGGSDQSIPPEDVERMRTEAGRAPVPTDIVVYDGAQHGFHCDARPAAFDPVAAADAWSRTLDFLAAHLPR